MFPTEGGGFVAAALWAVGGNFAFGGLLEQESGDEVKKGDKSKRGEDKPYRKFEDFENPPILCDSASATRLMKTLIPITLPATRQQQLVENGYLLVH